MLHGWQIFEYNTHCLMLGNHARSLSSLPSWRAPRLLARAKVLLLRSGFC